MKFGNCRLRGVLWLDPSLSQTTVDMSNIRELHPAVRSLFDTLVVILTHVFMTAQLAVHPSPSTLGSGAQ